LAEDEAARRRFLRRCGLEGILLAVSVAGGAAGERVLPLLHDDVDWDTLTARVDQISPGLDEVSAIRLLGSLAAALDADLPSRARAEVAALATLALERLAVAWDNRHVPLAAAALEAWFALASRLSEPPSAPEVARTWIELLPTGPIDLKSREALVRFDEWLALAEVLTAFAPEQFERFAFPERQHQVFAAFVVAATQPPVEAEELVAQILGRIRRVAPAYAPAAAQATHALEAKDEAWFEVRFETHPRRPEAAPTDRILVERVLSDLG